MANYVSMYVVGQEKFHSFPEISSYQLLSFSSQCKHSYFLILSSPMISFSQELYVLLPAVAFCKPCIKFLPVSVTIFSIVEPAKYGFKCRKKIV